MILDGKQPSSVAAYRHAVAKLAEHFRTQPDKLSEQQVRDYLLQQRKSLKLNSMRPILAGIKFFFRVTCPRNWATLQAIRLPKSFTVPTVLTPERVWQFLSATKTQYLQTFFRVSYTCGLRLNDARNLTVKDIDSDRMILIIRSTKGNRQRTVPLPQATLQSLRDYWATHRHRRLLFPSRKNLKQIQIASEPISPRSIQRGFARVVSLLASQEAAWNQSGLRPHTLRHSYATAMLEEGVNIRVLQEYMGHKNLQATEVYLHLTRHGDEKARKIVERFMNGPQS